MNKIFGLWLALIFLFGIGAFNIAKGVQNIKKRRRSTLWGIFRILIGLPAVLIPFVLYYFFRSEGNL